MKSEIKIAIAGIGNCASSLIQGIAAYKKDKKITGLIRKKIGKYTPESIKIVAAFDIDKRKVGKDVSDAIFSEPNNTMIFCKKVPITNVRVMRGPTKDGIAKHMKEFPEQIRFIESEEKPVGVVKILKETKPDIFINYLPVGSEKASKYYADCCLEAGVNFINAIPVFICSKDEYINKFEEKGLVCAGDDIKAQLGATITHRTLIELMERRGVKINHTYQLNTGGNTDFLNMIERKRLGSKKISKTESVQSQLKEPLKSEDIHVGPSDFVQWQKDNKICFLRIEGELFGGAPVELELRLSVEDSPNSAGVMIDVIRCMKVAIDNGEKGYLKEISAISFKHPKIQYKDSEASEKLNIYLKERNA
jgi:myo-inositol-1-phosphate synthase